MKIKPVLFHRYSNLISKGIREITNSYYNHAGLIFSLDDKLFFVEAVEFGVIVMPVDSMYKKYSHIAKIKVLDEVETNIPFWEHFGDKYDFTVFGSQIYFYALKQLLGEENSIVKQFSNEKIENAFYCFEFVAYAIGLENSWNSDGTWFSNLDSNGNIRKIDNRKIYLTK